MFKRSKQNEIVVTAAMRAAAAKAPVMGDGITASEAEKQAAHEFHNRVRGAGQAQAPEYVKPDQYGNVPASAMQPAKRPADQPPATYAETTADVIRRQLTNYGTEMARLDADIAKLQADRENLRKGIAALTAANDMIVSDMMTAELATELADLDADGAED